MIINVLCHLVWQEVANRVISLDGLAHLGRADIVCYMLRHDNNSTLIGEKRAVSYGAVKRIGPRT